MIGNIFDKLPVELADEEFLELVHSKMVRIERIVSRGQSSPASGWYDQEEHEWVMVLEGSATIQFADGREQELKRGDYLLLPAHVKHRVSRTDPNQLTLWLAVFYPAL